MESDRPTEVTSPRNPRVRELRRLHRRRGRAETGLTLLEGPKLVDSARGAGIDLEIWATDGSGDVTCSAEVIAALSTTTTPQPPVAVMRIPEPAMLRAADTVVLWELSDPGNAGVLIRTAAALGWDVATTTGGVDLWSPKVLRAGAGGHFATHLSVIERTADLEGLTVIAAVPTGGAAPGAVPPGPRGLVIGNETRGLPTEVVAAATPVTIPMRGAVESLNAAVAGAILMWALSEPG